MSLSSLGLLLSGLVDVRQRFLRVLAGLDEALLAADDGPRAVLAARRRELLLTLREHAAAAQSAVLAAQVSGGEDPLQWNEALLTRLAVVGVNGFDRLTMQHLELFRHLPRKAPPREDIGYLLNRSLGLSLMSRTHARLISVSESERLTWETTSFTDGEGQRTAAVALPWGETLSPLRWPLVVHELGHYLLPGGADGFNKIEQLSAENHWPPDAFEEVVADAVAQRAFGDAYAFALAREGYLLSYAKHAPNSLTVARRLKLLETPADLLAALPADWKLDVRESLHGTDDVTIEDEVASLMREAAVDLVGPITGNRPSAVCEARNLLRAGEPCPGVMLDVDATATVDAALLGLLDGKPVDEASGILGLGVHESLSDGEIYEAAWREEVEQPVDGMISILADALLDDSHVVAEQKKLVDFDTWLARSLQSAAVHRWLQTTAALVPGFGPS